MDLIVLFIIVFFVLVLAAFLFKCIYQKREGYARLITRFGAWVSTVIQRDGYTCKNDLGGEILPEPSKKSILGGLGFIFWPFNIFAGVDKFSVQVGSTESKVESDGKREVKVDTVEIGGIDIPIGVLNVYQEFEAVIGGYTCAIRALFPLRITNPQKCFFGVSEGNGLVESIKRASSGTREYLSSCKNLGIVLDSTSDLPYAVWTYLNTAPTLKEKKDGENGEEAGQNLKPAVRGGEEKPDSTVKGCKEKFGVTIENFIQIVDIDTPAEFNKTRQKTYETDIDVSNRTKLAGVKLLEDQKEAKGKKAKGMADAAVNKAKGMADVEVENELMDKLKEKWGPRAVDAHIARLIGDNGAAMQLFGFNGSGFNIPKDYSPEQIEELVKKIIAARAKEQ